MGEKWRAREENKKQKEAHCIHAGAGEGEEEFSFWDDSRQVRRLLPYSRVCGHSLSYVNLGFLRAYIHRPAGM